jgi:hypothetical protein
VHRGPEFGRYVLTRKVIFLTHAGISVMNSIYRVQVQCVIVHP